MSCGYVVKAESIRCARMCGARTNDYKQAEIAVFNRSVIVSLLSIIKQIAF